MKTYQENSMPIKSIDAATLKKWLDNNEAVLVDVRELAEFNTESIPGATLLPLAAVEKCLLPASGNKKLVLHCRLGKRSATACEKLLIEDNALDLYNLDGGIVAWMQAGMPVKVSGKGALPLDRQVQVIIGIGVLLGAVLGYSVSSGFYMLSAFFGAALIHAGLTGNGIIANMIAKMPWNKN